MKSITLMTVMCMAAVCGFSQAPTLQNLKGSYVFTQQGNMQSNQSVTGLGVMTLDGNGNVACNETLQLPGTNLISNCSGKYYVNSDGSGTIEIIYDAAFSAGPVSDGGDPQIATARFKFYVAGAGKQLKAIRTENGVFVIATFEKN